MNENFEKMSLSIINGSFTFDSAFNDISQEAIELIRQLIVVTPSERLTATNCLQSAWITQVSVYIMCVVKSESVVPSVIFFACVTLFV